MYDVKGTQGGENDRGRMQRAFDKWTESANEEKVSELAQKIKSNVDSNINIKEEGTQEQSADSITGSDAKEPDTPKINVSHRAMPQIHRESADEDRTRLFNADTVSKTDGFTEKRGDSDIAGEASVPDNNGETPQLEENVSTKAQRIRENIIKSGKSSGASETSDACPKTDELAEVESEQKSYFKSLIIHFSVSIFITAVLAVMSAVSAYMPSYLSSGGLSSVYIFANLVLLIIIGAVNFTSAFKGIGHLFTFNPDSDSIVSLSFYTALIGTVCTLYYSVFMSGFPSGVSAAAVYAPCAAAAISFNLLGKVFYVARVRNNLSLLKETDCAYAARMLSEKTSSDLLPATDGIPSVAELYRTNALTGFIDKSYKMAPTDAVSKIYAPFVLIAAAIAAAFYAATQNIGGGITLFCAVCGIASPIFFELGVSIPFYRSCKSLAGNGSILTGCEDVSNFGSIDAILADGNLIFPGKGTKIIGIKTFHKEKIEDAVLFASSIANAGKSPLSSAFLDIFADVGIGRKLQKKVDKIVFEDERGLYAIIEGETVLLGNRQLMHHHMVETPPRDYEMRYAINGRDVTYLAIDGMVRAIFIVVYGLDEPTGEELGRLEHYGVDVLVNTSDPNITPQLLEEKCGLDSQNISILDSRQKKILSSRAKEDSAEAGLIVKNMAGYAQTVISCIKLKGTFSANTTLQIVLLLLGAIFVSMLQYAGSTVTAAFILGYQLLSAVPVFLISFLRRN